MGNMCPNNCNGESVVITIPKSISLASILGILIFLAGLGTFLIGLFSSLSNPIIGLLIIIGLVIGFFGSDPPIYSFCPVCGYKKKLDL
jgi:hypothetical protein